MAKSWKRVRFQTRTSEIAYRYPAPGVVLSVIQKSVSRGKVRRAIVGSGQTETAACADSSGFGTALKASLPNPVPRSTRCTVCLPACSASAR